MRAEKTRRRIEAERHRIATDETLIRERSSTLYGFIAEFWSVLEPKTPFVGGWAIKAMCDHLEAVTDGRIQYLLITVPPGMMKSLLVAVFWPAYEWAARGMTSTRYLTSSYSEANVLRDNQKMRRLVECEKYQALWGSEVQFAKDQNAKGKFENTRTGGREGRAFGSMTGGRGDRVIIDDPHSVDTAESDVQRAATVTTFREAIPDRLNDMQRSAIVIIMQRLHEQDVAGTILKLGLPYVHLNLPMEFDPERKCVTKIGFEDPRTTDGELLFPERFPRAEVEGLKLAKGSYAYAGQYQQRPAPREGGLFKRHWFKIVTALPSGCRNPVRGWDLGATEGGGDPTAGVKAYRDGKDWGFYFTNAIRQQLGAAGVEALIVNTARADGPGCTIRLPQDPGAAGKSYVQILMKALAGFPVKSVQPTGDKVTRALALAGQAEAGNVHILMTGNPAQDAWIEPFIDELCTFPAGAHDDQVDAAADAFNELALAPDLTVRVQPLRM